MVNIEGFKGIRLDRRTKKRGGGPIIYQSDLYVWTYLDQRLNMSNEDIKVLSILKKTSSASSMFEPSLCTS